MSSYITGNKGGVGDRDSYGSSGGGAGAGAVGGNPFMDPATPTRRTSAVVSSVNVMEFDDPAVANVCT
jgi:hypothetical protein